MTARSANTTRWWRRIRVDKAGAQFDLAQAYFAAGQKDKAQESVLAALEVAPGLPARAEDVAGVASDRPQNRTEREGD